MKKFILGLFIIFLTYFSFSENLYISNVLKGIYLQPEIEVACYNAMNLFIEKESDSNLIVQECNQYDYCYPKITYGLYSSFIGKGAQDIKVVLEVSPDEQYEIYLNCCNKELILSNAKINQNQGNKIFELPYNSTSARKEKKSDNKKKKNNKYSEFVTEKANGIFEVDFSEIDDIYDLFMTEEENYDLDFWDEDYLDEAENCTLELNHEQTVYAEKLTNIIYLMCKAFKSSLYAKTPVKESINYLDSLSLGNYYNFEKKYTSNWISNFEVLEDDSIVVNNSLGLTAFTKNGEYICSLSDQVPSESISSDAWTVFKNNKNRIKAVNFNSPYVFDFDNEINFIGQTKYNFPAYNYINYISLYDNDKILINSPGESVIQVNKGLNQNDMLNISGYRCFNNLIPGPDKELWLLDVNCIFIYTSDLNLKKVIYLDKIESNAFENGYILVVHEDNTFIWCNDRNIFRKYNQDGKIITEFKVPDSGIKTGRYKDGLYYFAGLNGELLRYYDNSYKITDLQKVTQEFDKYISSVDKSKPFDYKRYFELAETYANEKSYWQAYNLIGKYLQYCPGDLYASELMLKYELELAKEVAVQHKDKAIDLYETYGEESAKKDYSTSMKLIEKFMKLFPNDEQLNDMYYELKYTFSDGEVTKTKAIPAVSIESVYITSVFPALQNYYNHNANGKIVLKNTSDNEIKNIRVASELKKYMDFLSTTDEIKSLKPGETIEVDLFTFLNNKILTIPENTNSQIQISITWENNGAKEKISVSRPVVLYNKSAISWNDTGMLSCFILPEDENIKKFSYEILNKNNTFVLSKNITNAISLINGIKSLKLKYVPDPVSPAENLIDNDYAIDSIKYPSETLELKGGDCDDLTVLFCSLLESAGIETSLITTEGHIFAAFNTGIAYNSMWENIDKNLLVLNVDGYAWIPIETTIINSGFFESWKKASEEMDNNNDSYSLKEITLLSEVREIYPPVSIMSSKVDIKYSESELKDCIDKDLSKFSDLFKVICQNNYTSKNVYELNSLARIYYSFNKTDKAIDLLKNAIKIDSQYKSAYINLINIYKSTGNIKEAENLQKKADKIKNDSSDIIKTRAADATDEWDETKKNKKGVPVRKSTSKIGSKRTSKSIRTISTRADDNSMGKWED